MGIRPEEGDSRHNGFGDWHWGFGFGHWGLGILFWVVVILLLAGLIKYLLQR
ncbi:MAG: hypothetical protein LC646_12275 [Xanthomonadaceae bacterium]|nr:hypothetical protein [Xanthomonadaceae bacterium]